MANIVPNGMLTCAEVAKRLTITQEAVSSMCRKGRIKATNLSNGTKNSLWAIREDDFNDFASVYRKGKKMPKIADNEIHNEIVLLSKPPVEYEEKKDDIDIDAFKRVLEAAKRAESAENEVKRIKAELKKLSERYMDVAVALEELSK